MKISIIGLGYVGCVSLGCLSKIGFSLIGVDNQMDKVTTIKDGNATVIEPQLDALINNGVKNKLITATSDLDKAVLETEVSVICVGTPLGSDGNLDLSAIFSVAKTIGQSLSLKDSRHTVLVRSTVPPGTCDKIENLIAKNSNKIIGKDFDVVSNPEFLREGSAVNDFLNPPMHVIGSSNDIAANIVASLYEEIKAPIEFTERRVAEIIKYVNNSFHALKVTFANEVGNICKRLDIDSHEVMRIFCNDKHLNISEYYLKPGLAYGGSCLPKDTSALEKLAESVDLEVPIISNISKSNNYHIGIASKLILEQKDFKKIAVLGLSFKPNTDDLRNSPILDIVETLIESGKEVLVYDDSVNDSLLRGENAKVFNQTYPFLRNIICNDIKEMIDRSEMIVIAKKDLNFKNICEEFNKPVIDLVKIFDNKPNLSSYEGLNWIHKL